MKPPASMTRRELLRLGGGVSLSLLALKSGAAPAAPSADRAVERTRGLTLGFATIALRDQPIDVAISLARQLEVPVLVPHNRHISFQRATPEECVAAVGKIRAAGLELGGSSVVDFTNEETSARRAFENFRAAGLTLMTCKPTLDALPLIERLAKEYDFRLAIHNHGPEDRTFPSPKEIWEAVASLDARIGLCLDVGHSWRAGIDPVEAIHRYSSRLYDLHLKDTLAEVGQRDIPIELGRGRMDIPAILRALLAVGYRGPVTVEYERGGVNVAVGVSESLGFVRGALASFPSV